MASRLILQRGDCVENKEWSENRLLLLPKVVTLSALFRFAANKPTRTLRTPKTPLAKASQRLHEGPSYPSQKRWTSNVNYVINMGSSGSFQPFADQRSALSFRGGFFILVRVCPPNNVITTHWGGLGTSGGLLELDTSAEGAWNWELPLALFSSLSRYLMPSCSPPQGFAAGIWSVFIHPLTPLRVLEFWSSNLFVPLWSSGAEIPRTLLPASTISSFTTPVRFEDDRHRIFIKRNKSTGKKFPHNTKK